MPPSLETSAGQTPPSLGEKSVARKRREHRAERSPRTATEPDPLPAVGTPTPHQPAHQQDPHRWQAPKPPAAPPLPAPASFPAPAPHPGKTPRTESRSDAPTPRTPDASPAATRPPPSRSGTPSPCPSPPTPGPLAPAEARRTPDKIPHTPYSGRRHKRPCVRASHLLGYIQAVRHLGQRPPLVIGKQNAPIGQ